MHLIELLLYKIVMFRVYFSTLFILFVDTQSKSFSFEEKIISRIILAYDTH